MNDTPWLIIGAGAIGLFWACKLKALGHTVHLVYRSENPGKKITLDSLTDNEGQQQSLSTKYKIKSFTANELTENYDKVLLCTKSFDLTEAFLQTSSHISKEATVACLCNGIGAQAELQKILSKKQILWAAVTSEGVLKIDKNHVKHTGLGDTYFGLWEKNQTDYVFPIDHLSVTNIHQRVIEKLAVNAVINPITAIFGLYNGDILNDEFKPLIGAALSELESVFTHPKFHFLEHSKHLSHNNLKNRISTVAQLTKLNRSSMYQDIKLQRQTENEFISGFLIKNSPIDLPIQRLLYDGVAFSEQRDKIQKKLLSIT